MMPNRFYTLLVWEEQPKKETKQLEVIAAATWGLLITAAVTFIINYR